MALKQLKRWLSTDFMIEQYYYINFIPGNDFLSLPDYFYFYFFLSLILILIGILLINYSNRRKNFMVKTSKYLISNFIYFLLFFWLFTSTPWLLTELRWLKDDFFSFAGRPVVERRTILTNKFFVNTNITRDWYDFVNFLEFSHQQIPKGASIHFVPFDNEVLANWTKYWLYPDLVFVDFNKAEYTILFDVDLKQPPDGWRLFKEFAPNKFILKQKQI